MNYDTLLYNNYVAYAMLSGRKTLNTCIIHIVVCFANKHSNAAFSVFNRSLLERNEYVSPVDDGFLRHKYGAHSKRSVPIYSINQDIFTNVSNIACSRLNP